MRCADFFGEPGMGAPLDRSNIQALIFQPYRDPISRHFLLSLSSEKRNARRFISEWLPRVTDGAQDVLASRDPLINISITWQGLLKLGAFDELGGNVAANEAFYMINERPNAAALGAAGLSAPENWWHGKFSGNRVDLILHLYTQSDAQLENMTSMVRNSVSACGALELKPTEDQDAITGRVIEGRKLHFGYQDGISHPNVNWDDQENHSGMGRGHFLLGYSLPHMQSFPNEAPFNEVTDNGSYMAFVWMYQDVASFNRFLRENSPRVAPPQLSQSEAEEWVAAKLMGRWRSGAPLVLSPDEDDPALAMANDFKYTQQDPNGFACPFAAHIRVVNGRDQPLDFANASIHPGGFPRVLRRGMPYGPPLEGFEDDGKDRGTIGMFLCTNLNRQFYDLTRWMTKTNFSEVYKDTSGQDALVGNRSVSGASDKFTIPTLNGPILLRLGNFVRLQGVLLLLVPSISTLTKLSNG